MLLGGSREIAWIDSQGRDLHDELDVKDPALFRGKSRAGRFQQPILQRYTTTKMPQAGLSASQQLKGSPQYSALSGVSSRTTATDITDRFCEPVEHKFASTQTSDELEEELITGWQAVIARAAETSFKDLSMPKLVEFVTALQQRPDLAKDGQKCMIQDMAVWNDLPLFGWQMRDAWNFGWSNGQAAHIFANGLLSAAEDRSAQEQKDQWINLNAFTAALVVAAHSESNDHPDFSLYCIWTVRQALEEEKFCDVAVAAAAVWFIYAAPTIRDFSRKHKSFDGKVAKG